MDSEYLRFVLALVLVLGLILLLAWLLRRFGAGGLVRPGGKRRLQIVETAAAGPRHRLMLVRRDDTEHLILMGPNGDVVVERGIHPPADSNQPAGRSTGASFQETLARRDHEGPTLRAERHPVPEAPRGGEER